MAKYKYILAIDTATGPSSVALASGNNVLSYIENMDSSAQSSQLVPMVEHALAKAGLSYAGLDAIACTVGPGSFTGLRVGLASARAIGLATAKPVLGFTTLEVLAYAASLQAKHSQPILAALNAGKGEEYLQRFHSVPFAANGDPWVGKAADISPNATDGALLCGNVDLPGLTHAGVRHPRADALAMLAMHGTLPVRPPSPLYIRPPDAKPMAKTAP